MLEAMRQNSRSAIIYILFGILIAAFVISFGPGSGGGPTMSTGDHFAAKIDGSEVSEDDFHFAYVALGAANLPGNMAREQRIKEFIMDRLIERELLARQGERLGLASSEKEAAEMVADGRIMVIGMPRRVEGYAFKDGKFDYERFRMVAQNHYRVTIKELMEIQERELLADKVREVLRAGTRVSPDEVKADFEEKGRQVNLAYVRFQPRSYEAEVQLSDSDIEAWARAHEAEIKKAYDERKFLYQKQDRTVHLRRVLIEVEKDAPADKVKEAEGKLETVKKTLGSGTTFADVARTESQDTATRTRGGDMGWRKKGFTGLGDEADGKLFAAKEGELVGPLRTDRGLELFKVEGFREGDVSLEKARREIAEDLCRTDKMKEKAKAAATEAAKKVKEGGKLEELYPKSSSDADEAKAKIGAQAVQVEETGLFSRKGDVIQGLGSAQELAKLAFRTMKTGESAGPLEIGGSFAVCVLKEKKEPDMADWDKRKAEIIDEHQRTKWAEVTQAWGKLRCTEAHSAGKIKINADVLAYEGAPAKDPLGLGERKYEPCSGQRPF